MPADAPPGHDGGDRLKPALPYGELFNILAVPGGGQLVLSAQPARFSNPDEALDAYRRVGAGLVVSLLPDHELQALGLQQLPHQCAQRGLQWGHCPVEDFSVPGAAFDAGWKTIAAKVQSLLTQGQAVVLHCRAGLGRTGTVAARILIEAGMSAPDAVDLVRATRPGSIETPEQEAYLLQFAHAREGRGA